VCTEPKNTTAPRRSPQVGQRRPVSNIGAIVFDVNTSTSCFSVEFFQRAAVHVGGSVHQQFEPVAVLDGGVDIRCRSRASVTSPATASTAGPAASATARTRSGRRPDTVTPCTGGRQPRDDRGADDPTRRP
jgi:hypothetical protein